MKVKVSGTWRNPTNIFVRVSGVWRPVIKTYVRVGGVWRTPPTAPSNLFDGTVTMATTSYYGVTTSGYQYGAFGGISNQYTANNAFISSIYTADETRVRTQYRRWLLISLSGNQESRLAKVTFNGVESSGVLETYYDPYENYTEAVFRFNSDIPISGTIRVIF